MNDPHTRPQADPRLVSIGRLAEETGISPDRLRIWERRYGRPQPVRLPSGHRRYAPEEVRRIRLVAELLARGERAGRLLTLPDEDLEQRYESTGVRVPFSELAAWMDQVRTYRAEELYAGLLESARNLDTSAFLDERLGPLLTEIGRAWADGSLDVRHEHFAALQVQRCLTTLRGERAREPERGPILLTTLPGELHGIGVAMIDLICQEAAVDTRSLGVDTPVQEIARAALETAAGAVCVSISLSGGGPNADRLLRELRAALPADVELVVGGSGAGGGRRGPKGTRFFPDLGSFRRWITDRLPRQQNGKPVLR